MSALKIELWDDSSRKQGIILSVLNQLSGVEVFPRVVNGEQKISLDDILQEIGDRKPDLLILDEDLGDYNPSGTTIAKALCAQEQFSDMEIMSCTGLPLMDNELPLFSAGHIEDWEMREDKALATLRAVLQRITDRQRVS